MPDLLEQVTAALRSSEESPWLPGLAIGLAEHGWKNLYHDTGLTPYEYGTARVMARDRNVPLQIISMVPAALDEGNSPQVFQIELLGRDTACLYEESGVRFYTEDEINRGELVGRVVEAVNILKSTPTLFMTVAALVRSVHLIDAGCDDYDVSFSEPHIPFSIFISVPRNESLSAAIRTAEAIVHEAMHLQLTLVECVVPLVFHNDNKYYSPWKGEHRTTQGVLHALYVFRVIDKFLEDLSLSPIMIKNAGYHLRDRRTQIITEIEQVKYLRSSLDLSPEGVNLVRRLLNET